VHHAAVTILRNSAECLSCGDELESDHVHDWQECSCGNVFVDGGRDYLRHGCMDDTKYVNTSITDGEEES